MDPAYAERYRDLASRHWWWRARNDCVRREVARLLGTRRDARVLDIGCGDGVLFPFLSEFGHVEGIEPDPQVVSPDSPWRDLIQIRRFDDSFAPGRQYDLILMLDVLEHLEDAPGAVHLAARLLQEGGHLLITVPAFHLLWTHHDRLNHHVTRFTKRRLAAAVRGGGMEILSSWYLFQWLFFAKLIERARERVTGPPGPAEVPPEPVNVALYRCCRAEQRLAGRVVPFGSSLIAVARRAGGPREDRAPRAVREDKGKGPVLGLAVLVLFSTTLFARRAASLPFWYDELLTVRLSALGGVSELWSALTGGFEFTPPLGYLATKLARTLPGPETLTARVPPLAGYVLLVVTLFIFLRRRIGGWFALSAVALLPLADFTIRYAVEARPYMLVLGMSGCALVFWQATVNKPGSGDRDPESDPSGQGGAWAPIGLAISVALALLLHVWAILLPLALAAGELVEVARSRSVRWRVVGALAAAAPVLGLYPAILSASRNVIFGGPIYEPTLLKLYGAIRSELPRPRALVAAALVAAFVAAWWARRRAPPEPPRPGLRPDELAVMWMLMLSPCVPYAYAQMARGAFMPRYAMYALPALICLAGVLLHRLGRGLRISGQCAAVVMLLGVLVYLPRKVPIERGRLAVVESLAGAHDRLDPSVPIVLVNPIDVLPFDEQAGEDLRLRTRYVADPGLALQETGTNGIDLGYVLGERYLKLSVRRVSYDELAGHSRLYLAGKWHELSWLPKRLQQDGWQLSPIGGTPQAPLFEGRR